MTMLAYHARPAGMNTRTAPTTCRISRATLHALHELRRRTGLALDAIIYDLATRALTSSDPAAMLNMMVDPMTRPRPDRQTESPGDGHRGFLPRNT
jgi:hypothetical protein